jgi:predicted heme/steroid binding protein
MAEVRQRGPKTTKEPVATTDGRAETIERSSSSFSVVDIARSIVFLLLGSGLLSWFVTGNDVWWGHRPSFTRIDVLKTWIVSHPFAHHPNRPLLTFAQSGPVQLTDADLKKYDGTNPELPIYVAVNGTIYDVSNGRNFYGPGGSYHFFAGADATRAFVTECFDSDITPDIRGVELKYIPKDDPEVDKLFTSGELKVRKEWERRHAKQQVDKAIKHWVDFFSNSKKYTTVGQVKREKGWETKGAIPELCAKAEKSRPKRKPPTKAPVA